MIGDEDARANARRGLSERMPLATWPPAIGMRIHYNSGWAHTSWTAEVRGVVDGVVAVVWRTNPAAGRSRWALLDKTEFAIFKLRVGSLPKALTRRE